MIVSFVIPFQFGDTRYKVHSSSMPNVHGYRTSGRRVNARRDPSGQLIIDQEEDNLSDKEMYARNVPAIGETLVEKINTLKPS